MNNDFSLSRDLVQEIIGLIGSDQVFTDIHIEQDAPMMIKTPRGWQEVGGEPVLMEEMTPVLDSIDREWAAKLPGGAIDRPFVLTRCRLRCNAFLASGGTKVVISIRRLPLHPIPLERTGLPQYVKTMLEATKGVIFVTGPTGAGKTTTLASMLDHINSTRTGHIVTIEQPIEYQLMRKKSIVSQKEVVTDTPSFSSGLREAMRQNPDVIMVGEIRDQETAETVLHAGESGHLVLATMHTNSAVNAITKLLSFFPHHQQEQRAIALANSMIGVICQGLVPTENGDAFVLASELLFNNNQQIAKFIADPAKLPLLADFMKRREDNMSRCLNEDLAQLVGRKLISPKDAMRVAYNRIELHEMISSKR
ncbi:type IV pilus twitching motility protein PilT [Noviherbaspirillum saxi]|uniref:Twitching motility protein PilT n=1 Tax=Noviherbaspirillum saxi TaxID=2320863 RepID=A0A3A3FYI5_9BURK|nr:ATPase, T2SS/T4P/T4SS family [Noviherbaspirillum saxi]RJF92149.1 twitching motility protein PilT [Noviherbaspirillum saxi]